MFKCVSWDYHDVDRLHIEDTCFNKFVWFRYDGRTNHLTTAIRSDKFCKELLKIYTELGQYPVSGYINYLQWSLRKVHFTNSNLLSWNNYFAETVIRHSSLEERKLLSLYFFAAKHRLTQLKIK